jgi:hypothetical protein
MNTSAPKLKTSPKVLIVEGYSDLTFYAEFLETLGRHTGVYIKDMGGRERLMAELEAFITPALVASKSHLAVALDADDDAGNTFAARVKAKLDALTGCDLKEGEWSTAPKDGAKVGFFIAPAPGAVGEIEDLVWNSFSEDPGQAEAVRCVDQFIDCMKAGPTSTNQRIAKRKLGSLLAVQHEDDPRLGPAARDRKINFDAPALRRLRTFLEGF